MELARIFKMPHHGAPAIAASSRNFESYPAEFRSHPVCEGTGDDFQRSPLNSVTNCGSFITFHCIQRQINSMTSTIPADFDIEVFFDGGCPLCTREMNLLRRWDRHHKIRFTDILSPDFRCEATGKSHDELMARIHGRLPDGSLIEGVEVFRRLYAAVGFGWIVAVTRWFGISQLMNSGYRIFASNRLRLTGRCTNGTCGLPSKEK
jgi:predicted DCC family thiol-disulfide oxidoreductase YuxK